MDVTLIWLALILQYVPAMYGLTHPQSSNQLIYKSLELSALITYCSKNRQTHSRTSQNGIGKHHNLQKGAYLCGPCKNAGEIGI